MAIPPAWEDVWICADERGHLQAVGVDDAGRRQYLYHPRWRARRDVAKFERVEAFGGRLPAVRRTVANDLALPAMPREKALACSIRLLDQAFFRIGSEGYAARNGSFGLATIRKSHVEIRRGRAIFDYTAKGGQRRRQVVVDDDLLAVLRTLKDRRRGGHELLAYQVDGHWQDLRSGEINEYLKDVAGEDYSAKDFRTWHATVLASVEVASGSAGESSPADRKRVITETVKSVAEHLGNTPAVCRSSYIDPRVFDRFMDGLTIKGGWGEDLPTDARRRRRVELEVLHLLRGGRPRRRRAADV